VSAAFCWRSLTCASSACGIEKAKLHSKCRYFAEGINRIHHGDGEYALHPFKTEPGPGNWTDPFDAWRELWASINGAENWNANPWVWVVEFKRVTP
jgi:hypothetical protein